MSFTDKPRIFAKQAQCWYSSKRRRWIESEMRSMYRIHRSHLLPCINVMIVYE